MSDIIQIYSNSVTISSSSVDFTLDFKTRLPHEEAESKVKIFVSPQLAKTILNLMQKQVDNFENMYGEISLPSKERMIELAEQGKITLYRNNNNNIEEDDQKNGESPKI
jgi:hypothetical protein